MKNERETARAALPRAEHPQPQARRAAWQTLNGAWEFLEAPDGGPDDTAGLGAGAYPERINVPFARESRLSGIGRCDFATSVWYRRTLTMPAAWRGQRVRLHFGAVDWQARVWLDGQLLGSHTGGQTPFWFEVTEALADGQPHTLVVHAYDDVRAGLQAGGKQSRKLESHGCSYTRTTGIWQTVWLEAVGAAFVAQTHVVPDVANGCVWITAQLDGVRHGDVLVAEALSAGAVVATARVHATRETQLSLALAPVRLWQITDPYVYDLRLHVERHGMRLDTLESYFGMRSIAVDGHTVLLNGARVFQRLVLDQGFYPDGIWTAPTDEALRKDIELAQALGFNGARLHQKVFEPRFLYWADRLGYLVWGEFPDWGLRFEDAQTALPVLDEWRAVVVRDRNHPALIGWCGFNETRSTAAPVQNAGLALTRALDGSRLLLDTSGWHHSTADSDLYDVHDYEQNPDVFRARYAVLRVGPEGGGQIRDAWALCKPFFISEFGGIGWYNNGDAAWGYGNHPASLDEFYARFEGLVRAILDQPHIMGLCYTQLYDVEQEQNGLYAYDRTPKFDLARLRAALTAPAAYESAGTHDKT
jgi:beta-galactosidase/beta-glucuronidase